jgi:hypothetical protein
MNGDGEPTSVIYKITKTLACLQLLIKGDKYYGFSDIIT